MSAAVWASLLTVLLAVSVESHRSFTDDVDGTASTTTTLDGVVIQPSQAGGQHQGMFASWDRASPGRRRPLPQAASVQLVGVNVRRIQRKAGATEAPADDNVDDDDASNSTNYNSDVDEALADELHQARIR